MKSLISLAELLEGLVVLGPEADVPVAGLALDSRRINTGEVFVALSGSRSHGLAHAGEAVARGAAAIVYDPDAGGATHARVFHAGLSLARTHRAASPCSPAGRPDCEGQLPCVAVVGLTAKLGSIADRFYRQPSRRLEVIGVTGTNGKSSCTHYIAEALGISQSCAVMGTLGWGLPGDLAATANTTPDPLIVHGAMAQLVVKGVKALAMEVSSHGLHQGRVNGVNFKGAVFTNISRDHLDYHGDMEAYQAAKLDLLRAEGLQFVAANLDDASFDAVREGLPQGVRLFAYSAEGRSLDDNAVLAAREVRQDASGIAFVAHWQGETASVWAPLFGRFNVDNLLATLAVLLGLGYPLAVAAARLAVVSVVPGRMERFASLGGARPLRASPPCNPAVLSDCSVIVDYAHSPHALESVLQSLRGHCSGQLWCVFGCGGERDRGKRPDMGRIAVQWADQVVITDDNPRYEDGDAIVAEILAGCGDSPKITVERDRRLAIAWALGKAKRGDLVLVAGKGHESTQDVAGVHYPFSDRTVVLELLVAAGVEARS